MKILPAICLLLMMQIPFVGFAQSAFKEDIDGPLSPVISDSLVYKAAPTPPSGRNMAAMKHLPEYIINDSSVIFSLYGERKRIYPDMATIRNLGHQSGSEWYNSLEEVTLQQIPRLKPSQSSANNTKAMNFDFEIDRFLISPGNQFVWEKRSIVDTLYFQDGTEILNRLVFVPLEEIDYKKTRLIFMGNMFAFKEFFPIKATLSSLKVIHYSIGYDNYTTILSPSENKVYIMRDSCFIMHEIDISNFSHVADLIFKNKENELFFLPFGGSQLLKINIPVHEASLRHVVDNYYTDNNGLYYFDPCEKDTQQLESSEGKNIRAVLHDTYFVYGDAAYPYLLAMYPYGIAKDRRSIRLEANRLKEFKTSWHQYSGDNEYLGDNNQLFELPVRITDSSITPKYFIRDNTPKEPFSEWQYFDMIMVGENLKNNILYYPSPQEYVGSGIPHGLIKTSKKFYGIAHISNGLEAVQFEDVMIYNADTQKYESIDLNEFRRLTSHFYIYKNQMYYTDSHPIETEVDINKLQPIRLHGKATEFYTDGKYLLGGYHLGNKKTEERGNQTWYKFATPPFQDVDWQSLQVINKVMMIDKNHIYQAKGSILNIIPIKDLGLKVVVVDIL